MFIISEPIIEILLYSINVFKIISLFLLSVISVFGFEELNMDNFESKIKDKNVIVDFYAPWCPPCKIIANYIEDFATKKPKNVEIYKSFSHRYVIIKIILSKITRTPNILNRLADMGFVGQYFAIYIINYCIIITYFR